MLSRTNLLLLIALIASSLYLVKVAYDTRRLVATLERGRAEAQTLELDFKRLEAERQAQATHLRVERVARDRLGMLNPSPAITQYVVDAARAASGSTR